MRSVRERIGENSHPCFISWCFCEWLVHLGPPREVLVGWIPRKRPWLESAGFTSAPLQRCHVLFMSPWSNTERKLTVHCGCGDSARTLELLLTLIQLIWNQRHSLLLRWGLPGQSTASPSRQPCFSQILITLYSVQNIFSFQANFLKCIHCLIFQVLSCFLGSFLFIFFPLMFLPSFAFWVISKFPGGSLDVAHELHVNGSTSVANG